MYYPVLAFSAAVLLASVSYKSCAHRATMLDLLTPLMANFPFSSIFLGFKMAAKSFTKKLTESASVTIPLPLESKPLAGVKRSHSYTYYGE